MYSSTLAGSSVTSQWNSSASPHHPNPRYVSYFILVLFVCSLSLSDFFILYEYGTHFKDMFLFFLQIISYLLYKTGNSYTKRSYFAKYECCFTIIQKTTVHTVMLPLDLIYIKKLVLIHLHFAFLKRIHLQIKLCKFVFSERKSDCSP